MSRKIYGVTVGTTISPKFLEKKLKPVKTVNGTEPDENGNVQVGGSAADVQANLDTHTGNKKNPHGVTAAQVGARPDNWMPTAQDVGARPDTWMPSASDVGAAPEGFGLGSEYAGEYVDDANLALKNGTYRMSGGINGPLDIQYGWLEVTSRDENYKIQRFYATTSSSVPAFERRYAEGTWSAWVESSPAAFAPSGYGLGYGQYINWANIDNITANGWYLFGSANAVIDGIGFQYGHLRVDSWDGNNLRQTLYPITGTNPVLRRQKYAGYWQPWEWENPPMLSGVEYRTTERYEGKPVYAYHNVYTLESTLTGSQTLDISTGIDGMSECIRHSSKLGYYFLPFIDSQGNTTIYGVSDGVIQIHNAGNASWNAGYSLNYTLYYTKTN